MAKRVGQLIAIALSLMVEEIFPAIFVHMSIFF